MGPVRYKSLNSWSTTTVFPLYSKVSITALQTFVRGSTNFFSHAFKFHKFYLALI